MDLEMLANEAVAIRSMRTIIKFWKSKGYTTIKCSFDQTSGVYNITSNIGPNGYPPRS